MRISLHLTGSAVLASLLFLISACSSLHTTESGSTNKQVPRVPTTLWVPDQSNTVGRQVFTHNNERSYTVKAGDVLRDIALKLTGSADNWQALAEHNQLSNPNVLSVGSVINIPDDLLLPQRADDAGYQAVDATYDLLDALDSAQDYDAEFKIARRNYEISQHAQKIARSALRPQASAQYQLGHYDATNDQSGQYSEQQIGLSLSQSVYDRARSIAVKQAGLSGALAATQLQSDHEDLVIRVATSYFDVLRARAELRFRRSDLQAIQRQLLQTRRLYDVGSIAVTDVVEARAQYDLAIAAEISARNQLATAREALAVNTGLTGIGEPAVLGAEISLTSPDPQDISAWVKTALANNKLLLVAQERQMIAQEQVNFVRAGRLPTVGVTGNVNDTQTGHDVRNDSTGGNVQLGITVPIVTGGRISAEIAQETSRARLAAEQVLNTERQTIQATRDAYRGVVAGISRVNALRQALNSTSKAAEATQAGFDAGTRTSVELLQSLRDTFRAKSDYAGARYDYLLNLLALKRASGTLELADVQRVNGWLK